MRDRLPLGKKCRDPWCARRRAAASACPAVEFTSIQKVAVASSEDDHGRSECPDEDAVAVVNSPHVRGYTRLGGELAVDARGVTSDPGRRSGWVHGV